MMSAYLEVTFLEAAKQVDISSWLKLTFFLSWWSEAVNVKVVLKAMILTTFQEGHSLC